MTEEAQLKTASFLKGMSWSALSQVMAAIFSASSLAIAARLIPPNDFGLVGIAMVILQTIEALTQSGFDQAAIQRNDASASLLNTIWTTNIVRGLIIFVILSICSPAIASFFHQPDVSWVIVAMAGSFAVRGFTHTHTVRWLRAFRFNFVFWLQTSEGMIRALVLVGAAFWLHNVWALVIATLAGTISYALLSHVLCRNPLKLHWDIDEARSLFKFGRWISAMAIVSLLMNQADNFFVAKLLGLQELGYYQLAFTFAMLPVSHITKVVNNVTLSGYARTLAHRQYLRENFINVSSAVMLAVLPLSVYVFYVAPYIVEFIIGEKWSPMIGPLRILTLAAVIRSWIATGGSLFQGIGRPDLDFRMNLARTVVLLVLAIPLTLHSRLIGISWVVVVSVTCCLPVFIIQLREQLGLSSTELIKLLHTGLLCAGGLAATLGVATLLLEKTYLGFVVIAVVLPLCWLLLLIVLQRFSSFRPFQSVLNLRRPVIY